MGDNNKPRADITPKDFGGLLEAALRNVINQLESMDKRMLEIEEYIQNDIKNKAAAGRILRNSHE